MLGLQRWMRHRAWPYTRYSLVYRIRFKNNLIHLSCQRREKKKSWLAQKSCKMLSRRWFWKDLKDDFSNESTFRIRWPKYWMAGWHHRLNAHEFGWTLGAGDGQGGLVCAESDRTERLNWNELNWTELKDNLLTGGWTAGSGRSPAKAQMWEACPSILLVWRACSHSKHRTSIWMLGLSARSH